MIPPIRPLALGTGTKSAFFKLKNAWVLQLCNFIDIYGKVLQSKLRFTDLNYLSASPYADICSHIHAFFDDRIHAIFLEVKLDLICLNQEHLTSKIPAWSPPLSYTVLLHCPNTAEYQRSLSVQMALHTLHILPSQKHTHTEKSFEIISLTARSNFLFFFAVDI